MSKCGEEAQTPRCLLLSSNRCGVEKRGNSEGPFTEVSDTNFLFGCCTNFGMIIWNIQSLLLLCKFGHLRKLCSMTQCFWQCFYALQLRISAGMAIISDSVNNNRTSPTMWLLTLCFFNKKTGIVFYAFGDFFFFFSIFSCFFPFFLNFTTKAPRKTFLSYNAKIPPSPHTLPPKKTIVCGYDVFLQIKTLIRGFLLEYSLQACNCIPSGISMWFYYSFVDFSMFFFFWKVESVILF